MAQARHALKQAEANACSNQHHAKELYYIALFTGLDDGFHPSGCREVFNVISQICCSKFSLKGIRSLTIANITAIKVLADEQTATFGKKLGDPTIPKRTKPPITHFHRPEHITEVRVEA